MFFVLVFASAFANVHGYTYDEVLVDYPATFDLPEEVAAERAWDVVGYSQIHDESVIDLIEAPPLMPARVTVPEAPVLRAASSVAAVSVEARTRE